MDVRPLNDRVLVKRVEEETKTPGGIIIPDSHAEKPSTGEIVAIGQGYRNEDGTFSSLSVKKGEKILFGKYSGTEIKIKGTEYLIMQEKDILGILQ
jgi:chaperonin GroES